MRVPLSTCLLLLGLVVLPILFNNIKFIKMSKQLNLKKTKKALKNIIYGLAFEMSDSSLPEVSHFELANFEVKRRQAKTRLSKHLNFLLVGFSVHPRREIIQVNFEF
mgnify:CR=1 FL=1